MKLGNRRGCFGFYLALSAVCDPAIDGPALTVVLESKTIWLSVLGQ